MRIAILNQNDENVAFLDNDAPASLPYWEDELHTYLTGTASTFTFTADARHPDSVHLKEGYKLAFQYKERDYYFNIVNVIRDEDTVVVTSWAFSLELLNEQRDAYTADKAYSFEDYHNRFDPEHVLKIGFNEVSDRKIKCEWDGSDTLLSRLFSLADKFTAELEFIVHLNKDYSLKEIVMNIYHAHDAKHQGIGKANTLTLRYGLDITGISKESDITELYTAIRPIGNSVTTKSEVTTTLTKDSAGNVLKKSVRTVTKNGDKTVTKTVTTQGPRVETTTTTTIKNGDKTTTSTQKNDNGQKATRIPKGTQTKTETTKSEQDTTVIVDLNDFNKKEYDANGKLEFYTANGTIYAPQSRERFPSNLFTNDRWILVPYSYNTDSQKMLYGEALAELKKNCVPQVTYTINGRAKAEIGDTVRIVDEEYNPPLYLDARVTEQIISFTDPTHDSTVYSNVQEEKATISEALLSRMRALIDASTPYNCTIATTNGLILRTADNQTTLDALVYKGMDLINPSLSFKWFKDGEEVLDNEQIIVHASDVEKQAVYSYKAYENGREAGSASVTVLHLEDAKEIRKITRFYALSPDYKIPEKWEKDPSLKVTKENPFLWSYEIIEYSDGTTWKSDAVIIGTMGPVGPKGDPGISVTNVVRYYLATDKNSGVTTETSGWSEQAQTMSEQKPFLWSYALTEFSDKRVVQSNPVIIGMAGRGVANTVWHYLASSNDSGITASSEGWSDKPVSPSEATPYLWSYVTTTYSDGTVTTSEPFVAGQVGPRGLPGLNGLQGKDGRDGIAGKNSYFHIKYSAVSNPTADQMSEEPDTYIGTYADDVEEDSKDPKKYKWTRFKGLDGKDGIPGKNGQDGRTGYLHIAYADSADGSDSFSLSESNEKLYIGVYFDYHPEGSKDPKAYKWSRIKGADGKPGLNGLQGKDGKDGIPGKDGKDGRTSYFHIMYAPVQNPSAEQMSETPDTFIGTYVDFTQADSKDPKVYKWRRFSGLNGKDGIAGKNGANGQTSYLHLAYADSADGKTAFSISDSKDKLYIGQYTDFSKADSTDPAKYKWTRIKGADGRTGATGPAGVSLTSQSAEYYLSTSATAQSGGKWQPDVPVWQEGHYVWQRWITKLSNGTTIESKPVCITGPKGNTGAKGTDGKNGATGATGQGVVSITPQFYLSNSKTAQTGGSWSNTQPAWIPGKYLWYRNQVVYKNPSQTTYTTPYVSTAWEAVNELQIGGRNLLFISASPQENKKGWSATLGDRIEGLTFNGNDVRSTRKAWCALEFSISLVIQRFNLKAGDTLTYSVYCNTNSKNLPSIYPVFQSQTSGDKPIKNNLHYILRTEDIKLIGDPRTGWARYYLTFTLTQEVINLINQNVGFRMGLELTKDMPNDSTFVHWSSPKLERGNTPTDWTPAPEDIQQQISDSASRVMDQIAQVSSSFSSEINKTNDAIIQQVSQNFVTKDDHQKELGSISTQITQNAERINYNFNTLSQNLKDGTADLSQKITTITKYISFDNGDIYLGARDSQYELKLTNTGINFLEGGQPVATITDSVMVITDGDFKHSLTIGNFAFVPRANGSLDFKKVR